MLLLHSGERQKKILMGNLQLNVLRDSYNSDNTPLHVGLYFFFVFCFVFCVCEIRSLIAGKTQNFLRDFRLPPRSR